MFPKTMKAAVLQKFGEPLNIGECAPAP